jgi:dsDNA-binding SOS-regulon protein
VWLPQKIIVEHMEKRSGELSKFVMNLRIEVKLGQLLELCFQLREMLTKSLLKMEEAQIVDVCKVATTKMEDFDETILKHI